MDRIIILPKEAIRRIVSFLSAKKAVFTSITSILSKKEHDLINRCLCDVLKQGVLDLKLDIIIFPLRSLRGGFILWEGFSFIRFNDLRGCAFEKLLSACPVLEELTIFGMRWQHPKWSGKLCIPTLQRLIIQDFHPSQFTRVTLDTPSLTYLECSDAMPDEYSIVNLDSLVEAKLHLMFTGGQYQYYIPYDGSVSHDHNNSSTNPTNLIKGLGNVEIMEILFQNTFVALYYFREAIPVFENLYHLTIRCDDEEDCMGPLHYNEEQPESVCNCLLGYSFLLSCPTKVLQITDYRGTIGEVDQLKHFIEKLSCLKLVKLHSCDRPDVDS
ncbi:hypothetical protein Bca52824_065392 [Brassica carinata]|uniref:FBD domain-containing protein n=1 Tax=Brassica carinata TaxID=52824 RepID=A0A8X7QK86_BRACI|nr:hypothetical protein Bca52824_065392 [Brassica carinata]